MLVFKFSRVLSLIFSLSVFTGCVEDYAFDSAPNKQSQTQNADGTVKDPDPSASPVAGEPGAKSPGTKPVTITFPGLKEPLPPTPPVVVDPVIVTPVIVTPVVVIPPVVLPAPNSDICVANPDAEACKRDPVVTTPGVVTVLFTMNQIPQGAATLILANAIKYASPVVNPKIIFLKDSATNGEDEGDSDYIRKTLLSGYDVEYEVIPDTYLAFLKGLQTSMPELNGADWRTFDGPPITEEEYQRVVEQKAGTCTCGGRFAFDMPVRCPACRSDAATDLGTFIRYD